VSKTLRETYDHICAGEDALGFERSYTSFEDYRSKKIQAILDAEARRILDEEMASTALVRRPQDVAVET
jgi:hypothetical protein